MIVSDALDMAGAHTRGGLGETAARCPRRRCDLLCLGTNNTDADLTAIEDAAQTEALPAGRIEDAADRRLGLRTRPTSPTDPTAWGRGWEYDQLTASFDVQPSAERWRMDPTRSRYRGAPTGPAQTLPRDRPLGPPVDPVSGDLL